MRRPPGRAPQGALLDRGLTVRFAWIKRLALSLLAADGALVAIYLLHIASGEMSWLLRTFFDLNGEGTIPAWYTSAQLLLAGALLVYAGCSDRSDPGVASWFVVLLGAGLCFLSADEVVGIHETITVVLRDVEALPRFSGDHGIWIPIYLLAGVAFVAATLPQWRRLARADRPATLWLVGGILLLLLGAVGLEIIGYGDLRQPEYRRLYTLLIAAEEGLEMTGASAILVGAALLSSASGLSMGAGPGESGPEPVAKA